MPRLQSRSPKLRPNAGTPTPKPRKPIRKHKPRQAHWNPVPGALDPSSHLTKDKREKLFGVDKTNRRMEIFERSGGRCEALVSRMHSSRWNDRCNRPITWEDFEWSHLKHGAKKDDRKSGGIASCKQCHRDRHAGRTA